MNKKILDSYLRHVGGAVFSAIVGISTITNLSPFAFGSGEWLAVTNSLWVAVLPVLIRYFNKKDPAFGKVAEAVTEEITKKLKAKSSKK